MTPQKIRVTGVTFFLLSLVGTLLNPSLSVAQSCTGTIQSTSFNTTFTGSGNAVYAVTWPQYSPPSGYSLVSAVLKSVVSITASYQIINLGTNDITSVKPGVSGEDVLQMNGNDITDPDGNSISDVTFLKNLASIAVTIHPGDTYNYPTTTAYNNFKMIVDSVATDNGLLNDFIGTGDLNFTYSNTPGYAINVASAQVTPTYAITNKLSLTYYYCYSGTLAANLLTFTATRQNDGTVALNWISGNEQEGRHYVVQVSGGNGTDFSDVNTQAGSQSGGSAAYSYNYAVAPGDAGRLYFRIKVVDALGTGTYSQLRIIDLNGRAMAGDFSIYPNPPSDFINLVFPFAGPGWQVDIFSADGGLVQRNYFNNVGSGRVNFSHKLAAGTYFVRATDRQSSEMHSASFVIR